MAVKRQTLTASSRERGVPWTLSLRHQKIHTRETLAISKLQEKVFKITHTQGKFKHKIQIHRKHGFVNTALYGKY